MSTGWFGRDRNFSVEFADLTLATGLIRSVATLWLAGLPKDLFAYLLHAR